MQHRDGRMVVVMLAMLLSLLPICAAAQDMGAAVARASVGADDAVAVAEAAKAAEQLPPGKEPPDDTPGLPAKAGVEGVATDYGWSQITGTYTEITGGTQLTTVCDDNNYNANAIPFTFTFNGVGYTAVSVQCNGFLAMGATVSSSYTPISGGSTNNIVVAQGHDLQTNTTNSEIRLETLGAAPNRVAVVQWKNFRHYGAPDQIYNFQIRLYETTNLVEVVYGNFSMGAGSILVQVGLRGASNADFNNRSSSDRLDHYRRRHAQHLHGDAEQRLPPSLGPDLELDADPAEPELHHLVQDGAGGGGHW